MHKTANDFGEGKIISLITSQAIPLIIAQLVQLLYSIVDRIYIGHLPQTGTLALTGIGLTFPIVTIIAAFTNLFGTGGAPLFSMSRGAGNQEKAERILGTVQALIITASLILSASIYLFREPILYLFGASAESFPYADSYLKIYVFGTIFAMTATGMNGFINAMGYPRIGMLTVVIGAVLNLILDPVFIFLLHMGVAGAAAATVISQAVSAFWVIRFLTGPGLSLRLKRDNLKIDFGLTVQIIRIGIAGFIFQATNSLVQILCNSTLSIFGGDLYVSIMTVLNSVREILQLPATGLSQGSQPVIGYNYGAGKYERVKESIRTMMFICSVYTLAAWLVILLFPKFFITLFSSDPGLLDAGVRSMHIYFFGFVFMALQSAGQNTFQSLGMSKHAVFFSLLRKVIIVAPLTVILPRIGFGVSGVFMAEPVSNVIGGTASFTGMYFMVYRKLGKEPVKGTARV
ncbi:MAG: MATE family efflux transporter [Solobacterium sp.]|nr:MATE family efflux transporter [Solobacterium sp.]